MVKQFKNSESGRTMLEMLGVLGIMGIIMYGAIAGINYGMSTYKINQTYNEVQEAIQGIQDLFSWSRNYSRLSNSVICDNDIFSCSDTDIDNSFSGTISVESVGADGKSFKLTYSGVDLASCNRLKEMEWGPVVMDNDSCASGCSNCNAIFCPRDSAEQNACN